MDQKGSLRDIAIRILEKSHGPLRPHRIVGKAMTSGLLPPRASSARAIVGDILDGDVRRNGDSSAFVRTASGHYGINKNRAPDPAAVSTGPPTPVTERLREAASTVLGGSPVPLSPGMIADRAVSETDEELAYDEGMVAGNDCRQGRL